MTGYAKMQDVVTPVTRSQIRKPRFRLSTGQVAVYTILTTGCLLTLVPFVWTILASFKTHQEIIDPIHRTFFPQNFTTTNYETILTDPTLPLARFYFNSAFIALGNVVTLLFTSTLFGFIFAKYEFRFKRVLFLYILATMMIPFQVTMIPSYLILLQFDLTNNILGLVVLSWFDAFGIFLMRQFIQGIPDELLDAARIDGASEWQIYWRVILPQLGSALATYGTLLFMQSWNAYLWPLIVLRETEVRTLPIILTWYNDRHTSNLGLQMAASVLLVMPILLVYFVFQRWIVRGFTMSGLKGQPTMKKGVGLAAIVCVLVAAMGASVALPVTAQGGDSEPVRDWAAVNDYIIQLQRARVDRLADTAYDLVISDIALAGNSPNRIADWRTSEDEPCLFVAYMSIGHAAGLPVLLAARMVGRQPARLDRGAGWCVGWRLVG